MARGPKNKALENALRAAVKEKKDSDLPPEKEGGNGISSAFAVLFDPEYKVKRRDYVPRVRKEKTRKKKPAIRESSRKKSRNLDTGPSIEAIRGAYRSSNRSKETSRRATVKPNPEKVFRLSEYLVAQRQEKERVTWLYCGKRCAQFATAASSGKYIDLVVGLDFGTTFTKVVVREPGSRLAWAIPFTDSSDNPYLLPGNVRSDRLGYHPSITEDLSLGSLKMPILDGVADELHFLRVACYLALVIRHTRTWFLSERSDEFGAYEIGWSYHMGLPASSYSNKTIVDAFRNTLETAVLLADSPTWVDSEKSVSKELCSEVWSAVLRGDSDELWSEYLVEVDVYPEIAAQLHGHVASDAWDSSRRKFVMVDVGSGTIDTTMVNIFRSEDGWGYSFLSTGVDLLGTLVLHRERLNFLRESSRSYPKGGSSVFESLSKEGLGMGCWLNVPDSIREYVYDECDMAFLLEFDRRFRNRYHGEVTDMIGRAKKRDALSSHQRLPFILCGGGSKNGIYREYINADLSGMRVSLNEVSLDKPDSVNMPGVDSSEFHRLSVAYGLAFEELTQIVGEEHFQDPNLNPGFERSEKRFISKDDV